MEAGGGGAHIVPRTESIEEQAMSQLDLPVTGLPTLGLSRHEHCGRLFSVAQNPSLIRFPLPPPPRETNFDKGIFLT